MNAMTVMTTDLPTGSISGIRPADIEVTPHTVPATPAELVACLGSWEWRIFSGQLYKIMVKDEDSGEVKDVIPFRPNRAQRRFLARLHYRNVILKARQLGFSTLIAILWFDHAMFNANQRCGIVAHSLDAAEVIFRDKVRFAYDNLPENIRAAMPLSAENAGEIMFAHNNSSVRVGTSMRSGTVHRLHISEMGKIAAKFPEKAREIVTGTLPAVPKTGVAVIESTAEGQDGEFYKIARRAQDLWEAGDAPTIRQWRFHFFPWFADPEYSIDHSRVTISAAEHEYFDTIERKMEVKLTDGQRAWYVSQRDEEFSGDAEKMWQEYPSTPGECWQRSTEGTFLAAQLARCRSDGRIGRIPHTTRVPVNTFWDIGSGDGTAIWLHQYVGTQNRWIGFIEDWDQPYDHYVKALRETGFLFGGHFLPHDAAHTRQFKDTIASPLDMLSELAPDWTFHIVPRVQTFQHGVELLRSEFSTYFFDEVACKEGLVHLAECRKRWNSRLGVWGDEPDKDNPHTEAFDALRQHAQGFHPSLIGAGRQFRRRHSGGMVV